MKRPMALLATTLTTALLTTALLTTSTGAATAATDDITSGSATTTAAAGAPAADLARCEETPAAENARTAGDLINWKRSLHDVGPLVYDAALGIIAQDWANHLASTGTGAVQDTIMLPGEPTDPTIYQWWIRGPESSWQLDLILQVWQQANFFIVGPTHMGVGFATAGGYDYLYFFYVTYKFEDMGPEATFYPDVQWLSDSGITTGYADGTFRPTAPVTREAMAAFLYRYANPKAPDATCTGTTRRFSDVVATNPFCGDIEWLAARSVAQGWPDGTFRPSEPVTREATAAFLYRLIPTLVATKIPTTPTFTDVGTGNQFFAAVEWMAANGITKGWSDGTFRPGLSIERQAMAAFLHRSDQPT